MRGYTEAELYPDWEHEDGPARRRAPREGGAEGGGAAPAWTALLALAPFTLIGLQYTFRTGSVRRVLPDVRGPAPSDPAFPDWVERFSRAIFQGGNEVEVLCNGDGTFPRLWADLEGAERSIDLQTYYAESGRVADRTFGILERKAREGMPVRLLYDPVGCRGLDGAYLERVERAGGRVHPLRPLRPGIMDRMNHRAHSRIVLVDGEVGYTGDFGISDRWLGDGRSGGSWRSTNARFRGPALRQHAAAFAVLWSDTTGELASGDGFDAGPVGPGGLRAALLHSSPGVGSTAAERVWALTIAGARERCWIASGYFAPTALQVRLLVEAARRGVDVRVLTSAVRHTDVPAAYWAGRGAYPELVEAGVRIHEYQPSMMHAKYWVMDGVWCSIGALNLDNRSVALNDEVALMVHDAAFGERLGRVFTDDLTRSREVTAAELERSGWLERARAWGARRINPLL